MLSSQDAQAEINRLTDLLLEAAKIYYNSGTTLIDDAQYDLLSSQLDQLEQDYPQFIRGDSPTVQVGVEPNSDFAKLAHQTPMLSLANITTEKELIAWGSRVSKGLDGLDPVYCCEAKLDGLSMSVVYTKGVLTHAVSRGNGEIGDEVTVNVKTIKSLPHRLNQELDLELRGEVVLYKDQFARLNQGLQEAGEVQFKNPRNAAAGSLRLKKPAEVAKRQLSIFLYDLVSKGYAAEHQQNLEQMEAWGLPVNPLRLITADLKEVYAYCQKLEQIRPTLEFEIDGVVIKLNHLESRARLGQTAKSPIWARAWKFRPERVLTQVLSVENQIGRTGVLTPVVNVVPVELAGSTVKRASLYNYHQVNHILGLHQKDWVYLEKGGDIIPKVVAVDLSQRTDNTPFTPPSQCPECGELLIQSQKAGQKPQAGKKIELEIDLRCINLACKAVKLGQVEHFVSKKALDVRSLGGKIISLLMEKGFVQDITDLFQLESHQLELEQIEGLGGKSVQKILDALVVARTRPLNQLIFGLGIPQLGEKAAKVIALEVKTLKGFVALTAERLGSVPDVGPVLTVSLTTWLQSPINITKIEKLIQLGVQPTVLERPAHQPFKGKSVCITGTLGLKRSEWKFLLEQVGFQVTSAVSAKTQYLLAGEDGGSKVKKAAALGVTQVNEDEMKKMMDRLL